MVLMMKAAMMKNFCPPPTLPEVAEVASWGRPTITFAATVMSSANKSIVDAASKHLKQIVHFPAQNNSFLHSGIVQ